MLVSPGRPLDAYVSLASKTPVQKADTPAAAVTVTEVVDTGDTEGQSASIALYLGSDAGFYIDVPSIATSEEIGDSALALTQKGKAWKAGKASVLALRSTDDGGYELLLRTGTGAKASYSIQKFDEEGAAVGKASKMSLAETLAAEKDFDQDINDDGSKGDIVSEVIDDDDGSQQIGFYKLASGAYAIDANSLAEGDDTTGDLVLLTAKGKSWSSGKGNALAVRIAESGYEVLIKTGEGAKAKYSIQAFSSEGVATGKAVALKPADLFDAEVDFEQDFNDDQINGDYVTDTIADADSVLSLYMLKSGFYGVGESGAQEGAAGSAADVVRLTDKGKAWSAGKASAVALAPVGDENAPTGTKVILKSGSGAKAKISEVTFNIDGAVSGKPVSLKGDALKAAEVAYDTDFDDDGKVGTSGFKIEVNYTGDEIYKSYFTAAAQRWSEIIIGDLPDVGAIDDLKIDADVSPIDGVNGTLGHAGWTNLRSNAAGGLPYAGEMTFDSADMANMKANGTLTGVILHEMGHVLGLGTLWELKGLVDLSSKFTFSGDDYYAKYKGQYALNEYRTLTSDQTKAYVPLENNTNVYGGGSLGSHWRESVFDGELMTPSANGSLAISRLSIGSLKDIGYEVVFSTADAYQMPGASSVMQRLARNAYASTYV